MNDDEEIRAYVRRHLIVMISVIVVALVFLCGVVVYALVTDHGLSAKPVSLIAPEPMPTPVWRTLSPRASRERIVIQPKVPRAVQPKPVTHKVAGFSALELRIAYCESENNYRAENPTSTASGRWQVVDGTWGSYGGYHHAADAPPWVQDRWARAYFNANGYRAWNASRSCWS